MAHEHKADEKQQDSFLTRTLQFVVQNSVTQDDINDSLFSGPYFNTYGFNYYYNSLKPIIHSNPKYQPLPVVPINNHFPKLSRNVFRTDVYLPVSTFKKLTGDFSQLKFSYSPSMKRCGSGHPTCRTYREISRQLTYTDVKQFDFIYAVGDTGHKYTNYHRGQNQNFSTKVHCLAPFVTAKDRMRHAFNFQSHQVTKCHHKLQECLTANCICNPGFHYNHSDIVQSDEFKNGTDTVYTRNTHDLTQTSVLHVGHNATQVNNNRRIALLFVHSLYYVSMQDLAACMVDLNVTQAQAVLHKFIGDSGRFFDECTWYTDGFGEIVMRSVDDPQEYKHPPRMEYYYGLNGTNIYKFHHNNNPYTLMWSIIRETSIDYTVSFRYVAGHQIIGDVVSTHDFAKAKKERVLKLIEDKFQKHFIYSNNVGADLQPIMRMIKLECDEKKVSIDTCGLVQMVNRIAKTSLKYKKELYDKTLPMIVEIKHINSNIKKMSDLTDDNVQALVNERTSDKFSLLGLSGKKGLAYIRLLSKENVRSMFIESVVHKPLYLFLSLILIILSIFVHYYFALFLPFTLIACLSHHIHIKYEFRGIHLITAMVFLFTLSIIYLIFSFEVPNIDIKPNLVYQSILQDLTQSNITAPLYSNTTNYLQFINVFSNFNFKYGGKLWVLVQPLVELLDFTTNMSFYSHIIIQFLISMFLPKLLPYYLYYEFIPILYCAYQGYSLGYLLICITFTLTMISTWKVLTVFNSFCSRYLYFNVGKTITYFVLFYYLVTIVTAGHFTHVIAASTTVQFILIFFYLFLVRTVQLTKHEPSYIFIHGQLVLFGECALKSKFWKILHPGAILKKSIINWNIDCKPKERIWYYGPYFSNYKGRVSSNCAHTEAHVLTNRQLFDNSIYTKSALDDVCFSDYNDMIDNYSEIIFGEKFFREQMPIEKWFDSIKDATKRKAASDAYYGGIFNVKKHLQTKAFIKTEIILGKSKNDSVLYGEDDQYTARLIQGHHPESNVRIGPYCYSISKFLKDWWNYKNVNFPTITYASGMNREQIGAWFDDSYQFVSQFGAVYAYESDFSKFDKHHTRAHLKSQYKFFGHILTTPDSVASAMASNILKFGYMPKGTFYSIDGTRDSGGQDTTSGNSVVNGTSQIYLICKALNVTPAQLHSLPIRMIILGDDVYCLTTKAIAELLLNNIALSSLGWDVKKSIGPVYTKTFCSSVFMPSTIGSILTGLPSRIIAKVFGSTKKLKPEQGRYYCNQICQGLLAENRHNPIINGLLLKLLSLTGDSVETITNRERKYVNRHLFKIREYRFNCDAQLVGPVPAINQFYFDRYGITELEIDDWLQYVSNIPHYMVGLEHPVLAKLLAVDIEPIDYYQQHNVGEDVDWKINYRDEIR